MPDAAFFGSLIAALGVLLLVYAAGRLVTLVFDFSGLSAAGGFFLTLLAGLLFLISLLAVYHTRFHTVLLIFPVAFLGYVTFAYRQCDALFRKNLAVFRQSLRPGFFQLLGFCGYFGAFVLIQMWRYSFFQDDPLLIPDHDYSYYLNVAYYAASTGAENSIPWYETFYPDHLAEPYHYADVWLLVLFLKLYPFSDAIFLFVYGFMPFLAALTACGGVALLHLPDREPPHWFSENTNTKLPFVYPVAFLAVFVIGVFPYRSGGYTDSLLYLPKMFPAYLCLTAFLIFFNKPSDPSGLEAEKPTLVPALLALLALPLLHILYAPVVLTGICIWLGVGWWKKWFAADWLHGLLPVGTAIYIIGFYYVMGYFRTEIPEVTGSEEKPGLFVWLYATILDNLWLYHLPLWVVLLLAFFAFPRSYFNTVLPAWFLLVMLIGLSWLTAWLLHSKEDFQFIGLLINPACFCIYLALYRRFLVEKNVNRLKSTAFAVMALYAIMIVLTPFCKDDLNGQYRHYVSASFLQSVKQELQAKNRIGAFLANQTGENFFTDAPHLGSFQYVFFLQKLGKGYLCVSLTAPDKTPEAFTDDEKQSLYSRSPFYRFQQTQKKQHTFISDGQCQAAFVRHFKIEYLITMPGFLLSPELQYLIKKEITDPGSGLRVCLF